MWKSPYTNPLLLTRSGVPEIMAAIREGSVRLKLGGSDTLIINDYKGQGTVFSGVVLQIPQIYLYGCLSIKTKGKYVTSFNFIFFLSFSILNNGMCGKQ